MAKVSMKERKEQLFSILEENVGNELTPELAQEIRGIFETHRESKKVDENGNVWCSYFEEYLPAEEFKVGKNDKYPSMSEEGKRLHRTQKSMVNRAINEVIKQHREGSIDAQEMADLLKTIDENAKIKFARGTTSIPVNYPYSLDED